MKKRVSPGKRKTLVVRRLLAAKFGLAAAMPGKPKKKHRVAPKLRRRRMPKPRPKPSSRRRLRPKR